MCIENHYIHKIRRLGLMILEVLSLLNTSMILFYDLTRRTQDLKGHDEAVLHVKIGKKVQEIHVSGLRYQSNGHFRQEKQMIIRFPRKFFGS